jgi:hypothetical protein
MGIAGKLLPQVMEWYLESNTASWKFGGRLGHASGIYKGPQCNVAGWCHALGWGLDWRIESAAISYCVKVDTGCSESMG